MPVNKHIYFQDVEVMAVQSDFFSHVGVCLLSQNFNPKYLYGVKQ